jgi:hypothetical protein
MSRFLGVTVVVVGSAAAACIVQRRQGDPGVSASNDFVGAAVFAASGVGASVVNRKVTGDCYAACPPGTVCNRETGLCDPRPCSCPADKVCETVGGETLCVHRRPRHELDVDASAEAADDAG